MAKGSSFEREFSHLLSLWFTHQEDDTVFWRVNASGGRARVRAKSGRRTDNQYGDICAVKAIGNALTDKTVWELKRGYHKWSPFDVIDKAPKMKLSCFEEFWKQACQAIEDAGGQRIPLLVFRRDQRRACVAFPYGFAGRFGKVVTIPDDAVALLRLHGTTIIFMRLEDFFNWAKPEWIVA